MMFILTILKGLNLEVGTNEKIALVGPSGVGKSTIIQLLLRFYDIQKGAITIDGQNITDHELRSYRKNISLVPQEVVLFAGSIRDNISYGKQEATEVDIIAAAEKANCMEFIDNFPEGLDTLIGERGIKLSGDRIYVMKEGAVIEAGSHKELMAAQGIYYKQASLGRLFE